MIKASAVGRRPDAPRASASAGPGLDPDDVNGVDGDSARGDGLDDATADELPMDTSDEAACADDAGTPRVPPASRLDEAQLCAWIERIVERDERALTALYDATMGCVYGLVLRIVRRPQLAEEVVEEAYFQVWRQAVRFDASRGRAAAWLLGMARSRAIDALRHESRHRHDSLDDESVPELPAEQTGADELLDLARGHADLHQAMMRLSAQPRQLVALAFFRGLSHEEIASQTALPLGTVKSQIRRALISLREQLGDAAGEWPAAWAS
jgi:RNA polymerase sigma factor (sigma-70 family)